MPEPPVASSVPAGNWRRHAAMPARSLERMPPASWNDRIVGYELRGFTIAVD
jgi:hypothetical protein